MLTLTLICNIRGVGAIEVRGAGVGACDFAVMVTNRDPTPGDVARRLIELARQQVRWVDSARVSRRIVPTEKAVQAMLTDGRRVPAHIINLSASGVALQVTVPVTDGETITVGQRRATIARQFAEGVGTAFLIPLDKGTVGENIVL